MRSRPWCLERWGPPDRSVESGWCFFVIKAPRFWVGHVWKTHWGDKKRQRNLIGFDVFVGTWTCYAHLYTINCSQMLIIMLWTSRKSHEIQKFGRISSCEHFSVYHAHANHYQLQVKPAMEPTMDPETSRFRQMVESLLDEDGVEPCFWRKMGKLWEGIFAWVVRCWLWVSAAQMCLKCKKYWNIILNKGACNEDTRPEHVSLLRVCIFGSGISLVCNMKPEHGTHR